MQLAKESGIQTPTREQSARLDRKRKNKGSNQDWVNPHDPDARITKMKDGRTHLAHKAEHAVDLETGAVVAVVLAPADEGDTTTIRATVLEAGVNIAEAAGATAEKPEAKVALTGPFNVVGDKGYHSNGSLKMLGEFEVRGYISEPARGRRRWKDDAEAQQAVSGNRRRIKGEHGKKLLCCRGELVERSFAHAYETGEMRRVHLRGHDNILKRLLIHLCGFNLALVMRKHCKCTFTASSIPPAQAVLFQQMAELADRRLVRHRLSPQVNAHELPHHHRVIQGLFHRRVRQVEPLLQKVNAQHPLHAHRRTAVARLRIMRLNQRTQLWPWHHQLHLFQKQRTPRLLRISLKAGHHRQCPLSHLLDPPTHSHFNLSGCGKQRA